MSTEGTYGLLLPFDTNDPEFARGVECGRLWEQMEANERAREEGGFPGPVHQTIHGTNAEMVMRMCGAKGWSFEAEFIDDGHWVEVTLMPAAGGPVDDDRTGDS